jgi:hypothetical protein
VFLNYIVSRNVVGRQSLLSGVVIFKNISILFAATTLKFKARPTREINNPRLNVVVHVKLPAINYYTLHRIMYMNGAYS